MYIGLIDDDLRKPPSNLYPNLEIMKLASYYKKNRDIVELCTNYSKYERYSKIIFRKNHHPEDFPTMLMSKARDRMEYGGLAFSSNIYIPMENDIEKSLPDVTIYDKINIENKNKSKLFKRKLNKTCIRLQTANDIYCTSKRFLVYDKDAFYQPLYNELSKCATTIEFIFPQEFTSFEEAVRFAQQENINKKTYVHYKGMVTPEMAKNCPPLNATIHYDLIPSNYAMVSFDTGCGILLSYLSKYEAVYRFNNNFKIASPFVNSNLTMLLDEITDFSPNGKFFSTTGKDYITLTKKYASLYERILGLRRYRK